MKAELKRAFDSEMAAARNRYDKGQLDQAYKHLEVAHVLGQRYVVPHVITHWGMLKIGLKRRSSGEVIGQGVRIILGVIGSAVGVVPIGNTGGRISVCSNGFRLTQPFGSSSSKNASM